MTATIDISKVEAPRRLHQARGAGPTSRWILRSEDRRAVLVLDAIWDSDAGETGHDYGHPTA